LGPLVYTFGGHASREYLDRMLPVVVTSGDLLQTNTLNVVGIASILMGFRFGRFFRSRTRLGQYPHGWSGHVARIKLLSLWLLFSGGVLQYLLILPWEFGFYGFVLPGVIWNLAKLYLFGLMGMAYMVSYGVRKWRLPLYTLWFLQILIALIHFSKSELMMTIMLPSLGFYLASKNMKSLFKAAFFMIISYVLLAQFIHYARSEIRYLSGGAQRVSVEQRIGIIGDWLSGQDFRYESAQSKLSSTETAWTRLSYVNVQTFAMGQYDRGVPGDTLSAALIVLMPRVLWPEKPVTIRMSQDFYELVTGVKSSTHLGLGLFGEGYWNYGWLGVIVVGLITGFIFRVTSSWSLKWMAQGSIEYMPSIFLGINMALLGTTQFFANAIIGAFGFIVFYMLFVSKVFSGLVLSAK